MTKYPKHLALSNRQWKALKRKQIREAMKDGNALHELFVGCAYTPGYSEIKQARELLKTAKDKMSAKNWGR